MQSLASDSSLVGKGNRSSFMPCMKEKQIGCMMQALAILSRTRTFATALPNTGRGGFASTSDSTPSTSHIIQRSRQTSRHLSKKDFSTSAVVKEAHLLYAQPDIAAGLLVEFKRDQKAGLALLQQPDGHKNWRAVDPRGVTYSLRPSQIGYILPGKDFTQADMEAILKESSRHFADRDELMLAAWEIVNDEQDQLYSVAQMAELLFNKTDSASCYAAHRLLNEDRRYFKQAGKWPPIFTPRPGSEVKRLIDKQAADQKSFLQAAEEATKMQQALWAACCEPYGKKPTMDEWLAGPWRDRMLAIEAHAISGDTTKQDAPQLVVETMGRLTSGNVTPQAAGELLKRLGFWSMHQHVAPLRIGITPVYPPDAEEAAGQLLQGVPDLDADLREDLSHLPAWAVDSVETTEVDDAVSIETLADGSKQVWVHIADPTAFISRESPLTKEAARRASSLYLPTGATPMFPRQVAEKVFSLSAHEKSPALSVSMILDEDGALWDCKIRSSLLSVKRISYSNLDALLEQSLDQLPQELADLVQVAGLRKEWRSKQGAFLNSIPESELHVRLLPGKEPQITIEKIGWESSQSRGMVAELMIMANEAVASIGERAGLPLPYRGQAAAVMPQKADLEAIPEGPCREHLVRGRMTRSVTTTGSPLPHFSLGLQRYCQSTSPIRRYADLLVHWQVKAHLRGAAPPYDANALNEVMDELQLRNREVFLAGREVSKYWTTYFFQQKWEEDPNRTYPAMLLGWIRQDTGFANALLKELGFEVAMKIDRPAKVGEDLELICTSVELAPAEITFKERVRDAKQKSTTSAGTELNAEAIEDSRAGDNVSSETVLGEALVTEVNREVHADRVL